MQRILVALSAAIFQGISPAVQAGDDASILNNEIEIRAFHNGDPTARGYFEKAITESIAVNVTVFASHGWEQITVGPTYYLTPEMSVGLNVGTSSYQASNQTAKSAHGTISAFWFWKSAIWEGEVLVERYRRDPQPWYREGYIQKRLGNDLSMGIFAQTDSGWGPRLSYKISRNADVWVSPLLKKTGDSKAILGAKFTF